MKEAQKVPYRPSQDDRMICYWMWQCRGRGEHCLTEYVCPPAMGVPPPPPFSVPVLSRCSLGGKRKCWEWEYMHCLFFPLGKILRFFFVKQQFLLYLPNSSISFSMSLSFFFHSLFLLVCHNLFPGQYPRIFLLPCFSACGIVIEPLFPTAAERSFTVSNSNKSAIPLFRALQWFPIIYGRIQTLAWPQTILWFASACFLGSPFTLAHLSPSLQPH